MITILFDFDGTLIDSVSAIVKSWVRAGNMLRVKVDPNLARELIGASPEIIALKLFKREDIAKKALEIVRYEFDRIWRSEVKPYPHAYSVLKSLRKMKIKTAVVSSNFKNTLERMLEHFNFMPFLDVFVSDEEVEKGKPEPDIALEAIKRLRVHADECIVVGDTLFDVEMGKRAGTHTMLIVRRPVFLTGIKYLPDYIIPSLADMTALFRTLQSKDF